MRCALRPRAGRKGGRKGAQAAFAISDLFEPVDVESASKFETVSELQQANDNTDRDIR